MADFTSWTALHTVLKNALAGRDLATKELRAPDGTYIAYRDMSELIAAESWVAEKAALETASAGVASRRVHVVPTGGAW